ncbi:MAG: ribonuclease III [Candidatus Polarisedimenticolaceae bacterium]|nr:ribonuclease III [Candidatus Polarisedimenticolaceae bacterium]
MRAPIEPLRRAIGHSFFDKGLLERALTHRSASGINNERFEFLGDSILGFVIADELYSRFELADEGQLSRLRAGLVKRETLAEVARELKLGPCLNLGTGELRSGGQTRDSILSDALEAIFAAIYLDAGYQAIRKVICQLFKRRLEAISLDTQQKDPKTRLQEYLQAKQYELPLYDVIATSGNQHEMIFEVSCQQKQIGRQVAAKGTSRRKAEQAAAEMMLKELGCE